MNDIDELFNAFDEKKRKEQEDVEQKNQNAQNIEESASQVLNEVVLPVIKELSTVIQQKGHKAEFNHDSDYVELNFTPSSTYRPSLLIFHHNGSGEIAIIQQTNKSDVDGTHEYSSIVPAEADQEWIRSRTLDFIKLVLEIN
jgi:hypothetical protein